MNFTRISGVMALGFAIMMSVPAIGVDLKTSRDKDAIVGAMTDCGLTDKQQRQIKHFDIKAAWKTGKLAEKTIFYHITSRRPSEMRAHGINPTARTEVNFGGSAKKPTLFSFKNPLIKKACMFIFALPGGELKPEKAALKMLKTLGWMNGQAYIYTLELPKGTPYASTKGKVHPKAEIAFPLPIKGKQITGAWEIKGKGVVSAD